MCSALQQLECNRFRRSYVACCYEAKPSFLRRSLIRLTDSFRYCFLLLWLLLLLPLFYRQQRSPFVCDNAVRWHAVCSHEYLWRSGIIPQEVKYVRGAQQTILARFVLVNALKEKNDTRSALKVGEDNTYNKPS